MIDGIRHIRAEALAPGLPACAARMGRVKGGNCTHYERVTKIHHDTNTAGPHSPKRSCNPGLVSNARYEERDTT